MGCKKEFDVPKLNPAAASREINIKQLKDKYFSNINYKFKADSSLYCVVIADETTGNLYKDIYVKDVTGALHVKLINSGGLYVGDSIRINIKGCVLNEYNKLIQLDSVDTELNIVKLSSGNPVQPQLMTIAQVIANTAATNSVQSKLIRLEHVEFVSADQNMPYSNAAAKLSVNRILKSCDGQTITVRTSGYASFASALTPTGNGTFIGIASQYGTTMQLLLRQVSDAALSGSLCSSGGGTTSPGTYLSKDFNDNSLSSGGWTNLRVSGAVDWTVSAFGGQTFAKISNYISAANQSCETWYISPSINLSNASQPQLSFQNAYKYTGPALEVYVSTNYTSGAPSSANWTKVNFTLSGGNYVFVNSGNINLSAYKASNVRIAFKYSGSSSDGSTWELDDVLIKEP
jgi:hypothetical protein